MSVFALIDCNNFFVSCERVFRPDLWAKPVAVLSNNDGCIVARSDEVKALGIPMGAPYFKHEKELRAAKVTLFSANFSLYGDMSQRVVELIAEAAPDIEVYSVDESFVELSKLGISDYEAWAQELRAKIYHWLGVPVSIGLAPTKTLAKAASEYAKKHPEVAGVFSVLDPAARDVVLEWLPATGVWGFGWRSKARLDEQGITTAAAIVRANPDWIQRTFSIRGRKTQLELQGTSAIGLENDPEPKKSLARTRTFGHTVRQLHELEGAIASFAASAAAKLRRGDEVALHVVTFITTGKHAAVQRAVSAATTLPEASADTSLIIKAALANLMQIYDPEFGYKRAGVMLTGLVPTAAWQPSLLQDHADGQIERRLELMQAIDQVNARYGARLVTHATELLHGRSWQSKHDMRSPEYTGRWSDLARVRA